MYKLRLDLDLVTDSKDATTLKLVLQSMVDMSYKGAFACGLVQPFPQQFGRAYVQYSKITQGSKHADHRSHVVKMVMDISAGSSIPKA